LSFFIGTILPSLTLPVVSPTLIVLPKNALNNPSFGLISEEQFGEEEEKGDYREQDFLFPAFVSSQMEGVRYCV
jgi:hypothetical protein